MYYEKSEFDLMKYELVEEEELDIILTRTTDSLYVIMVQVSCSSPLGPAALSGFGEYFHFFLFRSLIGFEASMF